MRLSRAMEAVPKQAVSPVPAAAVTGQQQQPLPQDDPAMAETGPVDDGILLARVHVPELCVSKCLQFPKDQLVWDVKQQCLASLPKVSPTLCAPYLLSSMIYINIVASVSELVIIYTCRGVGSTRGRCWTASLWWFRSWDLLWRGLL